MTIIRIVNFYKRELHENKNILRFEYGKLNSQARQIGIVKSNVDSISILSRNKGRGGKTGALSCNCKKVVIDFS